MAYSWDNRVMYVIRYFYDIDNNKILDKNDFECLAVRNTIVESRGNFPEDVFATNKKVMADLWNELAELADFNKDGEVNAEEFKAAVKTHCQGKNYPNFPTAFRTFIDKQFKTVDVNGDGIVGVEEYRLDCITRAGFSDVAEIDDAFNKLCSEDDNKIGGINLSRYQELYAQFLSNPDESCSACYLFGPLKVIE